MKVKSYCNKKDIDLLAKRIAILELEAKLLKNQVARLSLSHQGNDVERNLVGKSILTKDGFVVNVVRETNKSVYFFWNGIEVRRSKNTIKLLSVDNNVE